MRWYVYCLRILFIVLIIPVAFFVWKAFEVRDALFGFLPPPMLAAQYTPQDVVGDLGGMKVQLRLAGKEPAVMEELRAQTQHQLAVHPLGFPDTTAQKIVNRL